MDIRCCALSRVAVSFSVFCLTLCLSVLSMAATPPALSNPDATPEAHLGPVLHGVIQGDASVGASGIASYIVPIESPPGTNGMAPNLSLNYHSGVQNGFLGMGWFISGLTSKIVRCPQTIAQDGQHRAVDLSSNDRFCMDGHRLLLISGTYGADGAEYRTESDEFSRIISHGGTTGNPDHWTVERKDGLTLTYGGTSDSKLEAPGESEHVTWCLNKTEDELGNYYTISYTRPATISTADDSHSRPDRIDYTGNSGESLSPYASIRFEYETRTDVTYAYRLNGPIFNDQRLTNIKTYVGETQVLDYQFTYDTASSSDRSRLVSLKQCTPASDCTLTNQFTWSNDGTVLSGIQDSGDDDIKNAIIGDFNGDGQMDVLDQESFSVNGDAKLYHADANGNLVLAQTIDDQYLGARWSSYYSHIHTGDFNADGRTDLLIQPKTSQYSAYILLADANGEFHTVHQSWSGYHLGFKWHSGEHTLVLADYDGDGRTDAFAQGASYGKGNYLVLADSNGKYTVQHQSGAVSTSHTSDYYRAYGGDFNGDGKSDILMQHLTNNVAGVSLSNTDSKLMGVTSVYKSHPVRWDADWVRLIPGDYNGDGRTDVLIQPNSGGTNNDMRVFLADEHGGFPQASEHQTFAATTDWNANNADIYASDFNGDGRSDLFVQVYTDARIHLSQPDGTQTTVANAHQTLDDEWGINWDLGIYDFAFADFDGDGRSDFLIESHGTDYQLLRSNDTEAFPDQLTDIDIGFGTQISFEYTALTDDTLYTKGTSAVYPQQDTQPARYVVSKISQADGLGGMSDQTYTYEGLKRDLEGRGDLGFAKITTAAVNQNKTTITEYEQDFPYSHLPNKVDIQRTSDSRLLSSEEITYLGHGDPQTGPIFPYVSERIAKSYDLGDGRLLATTTTTNHCDAYGNMTDVTVLVDDHENTKTFQTQTLGTYNIDTTNWRVGQLTSQTVKNSVDGVNDTSLNITTDYSYDSGTGQLLTTTREPLAGAPLELTTTYTYDGYGNVLTETVSGPGITSRTTTTTYDSRGQFPATIANALNHQTTVVYDDHFGVKTSETDPNSLITTWQVNDFGQVTLETRPDSTTTATSVHLDNSGTNPNAEFYTEVLTSGAAPARSFTDLLGRTVRTRTQGFDGTYVQQDTEYDNQGRTKRTSEPYEVGSTVAWNTPTYDNLDRVTAMTAADSAQDTTTSYDGFKVTVTDAATHSQSQTRNAIGQIIETEDAANTKSQFSYNQNGARTEVKNAVGTSLENSVTYTVDKLNRTLTQNDPDHGTYTYTYDALGQTTEEISPKLAQTSDSISFQYDLLGRMTSRTEPEGTTTWTYDNTTGGNLGVGQIHSESQTGFSRTYSYASTDYGRLTSVSTTIGSDTYTSTQTYNANGQGDTFTYPASYSYPTGLQVQNTYNALGYLERVQKPGGSEVYYQYLDADAAGRITQQWLGDGSTLNQGYESHSSRITSQHATIGATDIQELTYAWDSVGNMSSRSDLINSLTETFTYDNQDRLTQAKVGTSTPIDYGFNIIGNITSKSDTGNYSYALVQDHAVSNITQGATSNDYTYDDNGNLSNGDDVPTITWASYNKPTQLQKSSITYDFSYGPDRLRYKKVHTTTTSTKTTHYLGNNFEQTEDGTDITYRHVIRAGNQVVAILTDDNGGNTDLKYLHRDHLGSVTAITDESGTILERLSYGPWGQRRDATDWETIVTTTTDHRGYTGHEHLDDIGIIHMNGRVYSPKLGRMLSPDPVTQAPDKGWNYNRYTYVNNNPLGYTDPSGYCLTDQGCPGAPSLGARPNYPVFSNRATNAQIAGWMYQSAAQGCVNGTSRGPSCLLAWIYEYKMGYRSDAPPTMVVPLPRTELFGFYSNDKLRDGYLNRNNSGTGAKKDTDDNTSNTVVGERETQIIKDEKFVKIVEKPLDKKWQVKYSVKIGWQVRIPFTKIKVGIPVIEYQVVTRRYTQYRRYQVVLVEVYKNTGLPTGKEPKRTKVFIDRGIGNVSDTEYGIRKCTAGVCGEPTRTWGLD